MLKIMTIVGARPQIIKAAALSRAIQQHFHTSIQETIVHTGQHYDENMSEVFFRDLGIPKEDYNLGVGSSSHGHQTAGMISGIEDLLIKENPDVLVCYGDTNSTLAAAIAASKIHTPIVHIEAGLRSFNKAMPEEINRIMCDHASTLLFSPTRAGYNNLRNEGFDVNSEEPYTIDNPGVFHCGDIMYDNSVYFSEVADEKSELLEELEIRKGAYILCTVHRNNNTDDCDRLEAIFNSFDQISKSGKTIVLPIHPRTSKLLKQNLSLELYDRITSNPAIKIIPPVGFLEMTLLEKCAEMIVTDSGGVQKEAFFFEKPCIILRSETEWTELVACGAARLCDADYEKIVAAFEYFNTTEKLEFPKLFGDGESAKFICETMLNNFK